MVYTKKKKDRYLTTSNTDVNTNRIMSEELAAMIDTWVTSFVYVTELPNRIIEQAIKEGFDKEKIRQIIVTKLRASGLSDRTIRDRMPRELRLKNYPETRKKADKSTTNWQNSANSEEAPPMTASVETNEPVDGNKYSIPTELTEEEMKHILRNQSNNISKLLKVGLKNGLTMT